MAVDLSDHDSPHRLDGIGHPATGIASVAGLFEAVGCGGVEGIEVSAGRERPSLPSDDHDPEIALIVDPAGRPFQIEQGGR